MNKEKLIAALKNAKTYIEYNVQWGSGSGGEGKILSIIDNALQSAEQEPSAEGEWEITQGGSLKVRLRLENGELKIIGAMDGWGNALSKDDIQIDDCNLPAPAEGK